jgi:transposase
MVLGRPLVIAWAAAETAEALAQRYRHEQDARRAQRLRALWLVHEQHSVRETAHVVGVSERTVGLWLRWYREGGLPAVVEQHRRAGKGRIARLSAAQQAQLRDHLCTGAVYTALDAVVWVEQQFQVTYRRKGMYSLLARLRARPTVPRPHNPKSDAAAEAAWKQGGSPTPCARLA